MLYGPLTTARRLRLEQPKGRVQRIGQIRDDVHILSLRYAGTVEGQVYATLSSRFGDIFSVLGQLPDGFEDQWIASVLRDRDAVRSFSQRVEIERPPMELRYMKEILLMIVVSTGSTRSMFSPCAISTNGCDRGGKQNFPPGTLSCSAEQ
jgi:hypothetical protein